MRSVYFYNCSYCSGSIINQGPVLPFSFNGVSRVSSLVTAAGIEPATWDLEGPRSNPTELRGHAFMQFYPILRALKITNSGIREWIS
jgi:hypothetical protein